MVPSDVPGARRESQLLLLLLLLVAGLAAIGCGFPAAAQNYLHTSIVSQGNFALQVESELTSEGIIGVVQADGCAEFEDPFANDPFFQSNNSIEAIVQNAIKDAQPEPEPEPVCTQFLPSNVLVRVTVGSQEITTRTDAQGEFRISSGDQLSRLTSAGSSAHVTATLSGVSAATTVNLSQLDEVAALAVLDEMRNPSVDDITRFVTRWEGTPAGELALVRHQDVVCGEFRETWNTMMVTGDIARLNDFSARYDDAWQDLYCGTCSAECSALDGLSDFASELEMTGGR